MLNAVVVNLEGIDARYGWILDSRIERQGGTEFVPLLVQTLLSHILISAGWHGFLHIVDITQESSSGGGREICHELCNWGWTTDMWVRNSVSDK